MILLQLHSQEDYQEGFLGMKCVIVCPLSKREIERNDDTGEYTYITVCSVTGNEMARQQFHEYDISAECPVPLHVVAEEVARCQYHLAVMAKIIARTMNDRAAEEAPQPEPEMDRFAEIVGVA